jgi:putative ABC transport system ATP-binding protein
MSDSGETATSHPAMEPTRTKVPMPSAGAAIELISVGRRDPKTNGWLIREVSFVVSFGDRLGILGPSGAGKTVLLRALAMLDPIDAGAIHWKGRPVQGDAVPAYRKQVIYLHQRPTLFWGTVEDNLRYPFTFRAHQATEFDRGRAIDLLVSLGRDAAFLGKSSRDLSGGEAQVVAFVRAVQLEPAVLLLDEPTASLDPKTAQAVESILDHWLTAKAGGRALLWVSHDREQTLRMTTRRIALHSGGLVREE